MQISTSLSSGGIVEVLVDDKKYRISLQTTTTAPLTALHIKQKVARKLKLNSNSNNSNDNDINDNDNNDSGVQQGGSSTDHMSLFVTQDNSGNYVWHPWHTAHKNNTFTTVFVCMFALLYRTRAGRQ